LRVGDCGFFDCGLEIERFDFGLGLASGIFDCGLQIAIADCDCRLRLQIAIADCGGDPPVINEAAIPIDNPNRQSQSTIQIDNPNRQPQSTTPIDNPNRQSQSTIQSAISQSPTNHHSQLITRNCKSAYRHSQSTIANPTNPQSPFRNPHSS
jgi:hypothetical protein